MDIILNVNSKSFCAFCGKEIVSDKFGQTLCQCPDAQQYRKALNIKLQLEIEASKVMANAPKPKYGIDTVIAPLKEHGASRDNAPDDEPNMCW